MKKFFQNNIDIDFKAKKTIAFIVIEIITLLLFVKLVPICKVQGYSMYPTLKPNDTIVTIKAQLAHIHRGDIVIIKLPSAKVYYVKRIIATSGDTVEIKNGITYINGKKMKQYETIIDRTINFPKVIIPDNYIFVMGDNRPVSYDSRYFGPIPQKYIVLKALYIIYPFKDKKILRGD